MSKLPDFIFDSYKRYKADTNQLTAWLVETAKGLGYGLELPLSTEGELPRKHAPDATALGTATASSVAECRRIFVNDFIKLARFIAGTHHRIKVPNLVLKLARSAIAVRKRCAEWFRHQTAQEEDTSGKAHWHFITVLEEVVQILEPLCNTKPASVETNAGDAAPLVNPFSHLDVEDAKEEEVFETLPPVVVNHSASPPHQLVVYTVADDDDDDWLVATYCVFKDLGDIRTFLRETWSDYRDKKIDLITASVTTNMAFEIIRSMLEDLLALNHEFNNYETIARVLCSAACRRLGVDPSAMDLVDKLDLKMVNVEEFVYLPTYLMLRSFCEIIQGPGMFPAARPGHFGIYDPRRCRDSLSREEKKLEDHIILFETLPHFFLIGSLGSLRRQQAVPDELTKEMEKMACDKEVSLLLVFATQVYLDIHHVLREQVRRGFEDLRSAGVQANISLRLRSQNSPREESANWPAKNEIGVRSLENFIQEWILQDYLGSMLPSAATDSYYLLARHPFLCGMMQFRLQLEFQGFGLALATSWGTILCVSHLYEAGKHAGFIGSWKDMEWIMKAHDKERMFRGRVPQNVNESYNSLCLMLGASATFFASTSRAEKKHRSRQSVKLSRKGPSFLKEESPVAAMFRDRIFRGLGVALTAETMGDLLADIGVDPSSLQLSKPQTKLLRQWAQSHKITSLQFLAALRAALVAEQHVIRFDYVSLHMRCIKLLRELKVTLHDKFVQYYGEGYMKNETELSWVVGWILSTANMTSKAATTLKNLRGSSSMLMRASQVVDAFIQREGHAECARLQKSLMVQ